MYDDFSSLLLKSCFNHTHENLNGNKNEELKGEKKKKLIQLNTDLTAFTRPLKKVVKSGKALNRDCKKSKM